MLFEKTTVTQVDAVLFDGENVEDIIKMFECEQAHTPQFTCMEGSIQGEKITILAIRYLNKKGEQKKITVTNGKYVVMSARSVSVQDKEKFENAYEQV